MSATLLRSARAAVRSEDWVVHFEARCTPRELQVADLLMQGEAKTAGIARKLGLSRTRVQVIKKSLSLRINAAKRAAAFERDWPGLKTL